MRRPPTLLVLTAGALVAVLVAWAAFLYKRATRPRRGAESAALPAFDPAAPPAPSPPAAPSPPERLPATSPAPVPTAADVPTHDADVAVWMRKPLRTSQPFPPEAAIDPPHPPYKVPAWMIARSADAGADATSTNDAATVP